jgi:hypothetical protein
MDGIDRVIKARFQEFEERILARQQSHGLAKTGVYSTIQSIGSIV